MWVLTHYDVVLKGIESLEFVTDHQFAFIKKAGARFDVLNDFNHKIAKQGRIPLTVEYWAIKDWLSHLRTSKK